LAEWEVGEDVVEGALLVVSELLTNAVKHAQPASPSGASCSLVLRLSRGELTVAVHDDDRRPPTLRSASLDEEGGRGLLLVQATSLAWGYAHPSPRGKLVWAKLSAPIATAPGISMLSSPTPPSPKQTSRSTPSATAATGTAVR
jgi:hypothetical protein